MEQYVKIGVAGPVGSGKTALIEALTRAMSDDYSICVVTNDIYTREDAEFMIRNSKLPADRISGVETGGCPHTAIREESTRDICPAPILPQFSPRPRQARDWFCGAGLPC